MSLHNAATESRPVPGVDISSGSETRGFSMYVLYEYEWTTVIVDGRSYSENDRKNVPENYNTQIFLLDSLTVELKDTILTIDLDE